MLTSMPRSKKHELMLFWCRTPMKLLVKKIGKKAAGILRISKAPTAESERERSVSSFVDELLQENVRSLLIVGATGTDTDPVVSRIRAANSSIEVVCHGEMSMPAVELAGFDCLVVCGTESLPGYEVVSSVLSRPEWEMIGSHEHVWDAAVVCRRIDESRVRGAWEILDVLHGSEPATEITVRQ
jgi:hypothetical protein